MSKMINYDIDPFFERAEKHNGCQANCSDNLMENLSFMEKSCKVEELSTKTSLQTTPATKSKPFVW